MNEVASSLIVIDHHDTAEKELGGLDFCIFDMGKAGCVLTWEYLFPNLEVPELLLYLQDRDLWQWKLPDSRETSAAIRSHPFDFQLWESWMTDAGLERLRKEGAAILRYQNQQVKAALSREVERYVIGSYEVPVINTTTLISEIVGELAVGEPFAAGYFDTHDKRIFSLRSAPNGVDVGQIAKQYGGGGHPRSAGFTVNKPALFRGLWEEKELEKLEKLTETNKKLLELLGSQSNEN